MKMFNLIVIIFCLSHVFRGKNNKNEANTIKMKQTQYKYTFCMNQKKLMI